MRKNNGKTPRRKIVLRLPDRDHAKSYVLNSLSSPLDRRFRSRRSPMLSDAGRKCSTGNEC
jgi:hypothetical protein